MPSLPLRRTAASRLLALSAAGLVTGLAVVAPPAAQAWAGQWAVATDQCGKKDTFTIHGEYSGKI